MLCTDNNRNKFHYSIQSYLFPKDSKGLYSIYPFFMLMLRTCALDPSVENGFLFYLLRCMRKYVQLKIHFIMSVVHFVYINRDLMFGKCGDTKKNKLGCALSYKGISDRRKCFGFCCFLLFYGFHLKTDISQKWKMVLEIFLFLRQKCISEMYGARKFLFY